MTNKELEKKKRDLREIQTGDDKKQRTERLQNLAKALGANIKMQSSGLEANEAELTYNIHYALQTAAMVNMSKTAARNFWIALVASAIAFLSMVAAWVAVLVMAYSGIWIR